MEQDELLGYVVHILEEQGITYLLVGSLASGVYGEPRLTHDIDVVLELGPDQVAQLCEAFSVPDYYVSEQAAREAVCGGGQFNVIPFGQNTQRTNKLFGNLVFPSFESRSLGRRWLSRRRWSDRVRKGPA